jgi:hypothetical protein
MMPPEDQHRNDHRVDDFFHPHRPRKPQPPENRWEPMVSTVLHCLIGVSIGVTVGSLFRDERGWASTVCTVVTCLWGCYALFAVIVVAAYDAAEKRRQL